MLIARKKSKSRYARRRSDSDRIATEAADHPIATVQDLTWKHIPGQVGAPLVWREAYVFWRDM